MSEQSSDSDRIQEEVTKYWKTKQSKINIEQQLEEVRQQKKLTFNEYQSQQLDKNSQSQYIYAPGTYVY